MSQINNLFKRNYANIWYNKPCYLDILRNETLAEEDIGLQFCFVFLTYIDETEGEPYIYQEGVCFATPNRRDFCKFNFKFSPKFWIFFRYFWVITSPRRWGEEFCNIGQVIGNTKRSQIIKETKHVKLRNSLIFYVGRCMSLGSLKLWGCRIV